MKDIIYIFLVIFWALAIYNVIIWILLINISKKIAIKEEKIIELFYSKVNKIPAVVEIMKRYTKHPSVFEDIIYFHKMWIITNIWSIYDLLDLNHRIHREFQFLMKLSTKINTLHKDWNFLYIRNYVIFYEHTLEKEISYINDLFQKQNHLVNLKNISIIWLLIPIDKKVVI